MTRFDEIDLLDTIANLVAAQESLTRRVMVYDANYGNVTKALISLGADLVPGDVFELSFSTINLSDGESTELTVLEVPFNTNHATTVDDIAQAIDANGNIDNIIIDPAKRIFQIEPKAGYAINIAGLANVVNGDTYTAALTRVVLSVNVISQYDLIQHMEENDKDHFPIVPTIAVYMLETELVPEDSPHKYVREPEVYIDFCTLNKLSRKTSQAECFRMANDTMEFLNRGDNMTLGKTVRRCHAPRAQHVGTKRHSTLGYHTVYRIPLEIEFFSRNDTEFASFPALSRLPSTNPFEAYALVVDGGSY